MKNLKTLLFVTIIGCIAVGCASMDEDAKQAATLRCEMVNIENQIKESDETNTDLQKQKTDAMRKMNDIRKKYFSADNSAEFDKLFEKYKKEICND